MKLFKGGICCFFGGGGGLCRGIVGELVRFLSCIGDVADGVSTWKTLNKVMGLRIQYIISIPFIDPINPKPNATPEKEFLHRAVCALNNMGDLSDHVWQVAESFLAA